MLAGINQEPASAFDARLIFDGIYLESAHVVNADHSFYQRVEIRLVRLTTKIPPDAI